jgi:hypothetical protein
MQIQPPNVVIQPGPAGGAVFPTVGVTLTQLVFWTNKDTEAHWPVSPDGAFKISKAIQPGKTSNTQAPGGSVTKTLAQGEVYTINYTCKIHPGETGILEIVNDFYAPNEQISIQRNKKNAIPATALITGGKPSYTFRVEYSELPTGIAVTDGGVAGPQVTGSTTLPGTYLLRVTIQDALSNVLTDTFQITII